MNIVVDYGMSNLRSVVKAFEEIDEPVELINDPDKLSQASRIILPGVGAFGKGMESLRQHGWKEALTREVLEKKKTFLGICLGMQFLLETGLEKGRNKGLGWVAGTVCHLSKVQKESLRLPHMGWNDIIIQQESHLFDNLPQHPTFYFVHSFYTDCRNSMDVLATCDYGGLFPAVIQHENIFGCQFHPEKSHLNGLNFLRNFIKITQ